MKKTLSVLSALVLSVVLASCGGGAATPQQGAAATTSAPVAAATAAAPAVVATSAETSAATMAAVTSGATTTADTGSAMTAAATAAGAPAASGPAVKITVFAPQGTNGTLADNTFTKEAAQKFNIQFDWQTTTYDGASAKEKRQISLASGDYPDLYLLVPWVDQFSQTDLLKFAQQGVVLPLNDLIDQYAPNIKAAMAKYPTFKALATAPDGKIYGVPQFVECYHCSMTNKLWINSAWLKKLNLQMPKTTADFKAVLEAFKTKDPNGNGKADEVPLSGSAAYPDTNPIPFLMNGFIYDDAKTYLLLNNGKVDIAANKPEWKEGLAYAKTLYDAKLLDPGAFTQNADAYSQLGNTAGGELIGVGAGLHPAIFIANGTPYAKDYDAVPPLTGPHASYATYGFSSSPGATFVLTNKASKEAQIAAIKLVDYFFTTDGQIRAHFGEEGKDWRKPKPGDKAVEDGVTPTLAQIPLPTGETPHNTAWGAMAQYFQPKAFRDSWVQATDIYSPDGYERKLQEATHLYDGKQPKAVFPHWAIWIDPAIADEAATLRTNITTYVEQNALQFVTGSKDLNKDWDAYVAGLDQNNLKRYLEIMQQSYDKSAKQ